MNDGCYCPDFIRNEVSLNLHNWYSTCTMSTCAIIKANKLILTFFRPALLYCKLYHHKYIFYNYEREIIFVNTYTMNSIICKTKMIS
jgi:hypothetical protein